MLSAVISWREFRHAQAHSERFSERPCSPRARATSVDVVDATTNAVVGTAKIPFVAK
jgi:hypothetical protein